MPHASTSNGMPARSMEAEANLGEQYRLGRCLGSGGMGTVWQAQDCRLKRQVAIKFLDRQQADSAAAEQRFQREAMLAAKIHSPHVVQIFAQGFTPEGRPYIVMELLDGEDLRSRIARQGPLDSELALSILEQMHVALTHAHHHGLVHRDIKPPNIFLVPAQHDQVFVKLLDFGVAKDIYTPITKLTFTGAFIGTLFYISPEQLSDPGRVGPSADVWATAVTAYEMLTGTVPFGAGAALPELLFKISKGAYTPATTANPCLPRAIDSVFDKAFRAKPEERFRTIGELCGALSRVFFGDEQLSATLSSCELPSDSVQRESGTHDRLARRSSRMAALFAVALCVTWAWWLRAETSNRRAQRAAVVVTKRTQPLVLERSALEADETGQNEPEETVTEQGKAPPEATEPLEGSVSAKPKLVPARERSTPIDPAPLAPTPAPRRVVNYGF